ncbi:hypothetical protein ACVWXM_002473 [Bradyrhizobium sp. GM7.3]
MNDEIDDGLAYGRQAPLRRWTVDSFFPPRLCETAMLEECVSDHGHERMTMKALPGSCLKVIKPEFLFQLLIGLFANPRALIVAANVRRFVLAGILAR